MVGKSNAVCATEGCPRKARYCGYCAACHRDLQHCGRGSGEEARRRLGAIPAAVRREILAEPCIYCGAPAEQVDHLKPVAGGGTNERANLVAACEACNLDRNASPVLTWRDRDRVLHAMAASAQVRELAYDTLRAVWRLHGPQVGAVPLVCRSCGVRWPCDTVKAL